MSVTSPTDIGNLSLDLLTAGTVQNIETPTSVNESVLQRWYDVTRRKLLREHPWNFATKRAILAASSDVPAFGYSSQYPLPTDFVRLNSIVDADGYPISNEQYEMESGAILYGAESGQLKIKYVYDITDVSRFDALFVDLFAIDLALAVAFKITASNTDVQRLNELRKVRASMSKSIDGQERPPQRRQVSRARNARLSGISSTPHRVIYD
jgi:hypothetical protein